MLQEHFLIGLSTKPDGYEKDFLMARFLMCVPPAFSTNKSLINN